MDLIDRWTGVRTGTRGGPTRFATLIAIAGTEPPAGAEPGLGRPLTVAIAVVTWESDVLIVQRRGDDGGGITWQFPAGMVKPRTAPETTAIREPSPKPAFTAPSYGGSGATYIRSPTCTANTCCATTSPAKPKPGPAENAAVTWAPINGLARFIPADRIFPPILEALEAIQ